MDPIGIALAIIERGVGSGYQGTAGKGEIAGLKNPLTGEAYSGRISLESFTWDSLTWEMVIVADGERHIVRAEMVMESQPEKTSGKDEGGTGTGNQ